MQTFLDCQCEVISCATCLIFSKRDKRLRSELWGCRLQGLTRRRLEEQSGTPPRKEASENQQHHLEMAPGIRDSSWQENSDYVKKKKKENSDSEKRCVGAKDNIHLCVCSQPGQGLTGLSNFLFPMPKTKRKGFGLASPRLFVQIQDISSLDHWPFIEQAAFSACQFCILPTGSEHQRISLL